MNHKGILLARGQAVIGPGQGTLMSILSALMVSGAYQGSHKTKPFAS